MNFSSMAVLISFFLDLPTLGFFICEPSLITNGSGGLLTDLGLEFCNKGGEFK
jgi:hypothetical protein